VINNWHVPRNKRKLYPVVDVLSVFTLQNMGQRWTRDVGRQLDFEAELEHMGLKRPGQRRDQRAGGARTYESWLSALGLTFEETQNGQTRLTMAGDALVNGLPPVPIITNQLMKFQYPSPYSMRSRVNINARFRIRPFRFILRLLRDVRIGNLTKQEIARFVLTEAENETDRCFEHVVNRILDYRQNGDTVLPHNFPDMYPSTNTGVRSLDDTIAALEDNANTFINYLEYTQLIVRDTPRNPIYIPNDRIQDVDTILNDGSNVVRINTTNQYWEENFQRHFGLLQGQNRDNRRFDEEQVTGNMIAERIVYNHFFQFARTQPIMEITPLIIQEVSNASGIPQNVVEEALEGLNITPFSLFENNYIDMAFSSREFARQFELSTVDVFEMLGFPSVHVGDQPRNPDVFSESPTGYSGIIDNKAYHEFSATHDYELKMKNTYIPTFRQHHPNLSFFMYIAGGFGANIDQQVATIARDSGTNGCAIKAKDLMRLLRKHQENPIDHQDLKTLFECNRRITLQDIDSL
jgi:hypothetical protein